MRGDDLGQDNRERKQKIGESIYPSVSYEIAAEIEEKTGMEVRVTVPGHMQRGGNPCIYDRVLCTRLGSEAAAAIMDKDFGNMIAMVNGETTRVPLEDVAGKLKAVDPESDMVKDIKRMGISFGE